MRIRALAISLFVTIVAAAVVISMQPAGAAKVVALKGRSTTSTTAASPTTAPTTTAAPTTTTTAAPTTTTTAAPTTTTTTAAPTTTTTAAPTTTTTAAPTTTTTAAPPVQTTTTPPGPCTSAAQRVVAVSTAAELQAALTGAAAGDRIEVADGVYNGQFLSERSGTATNRIRLCGTRGAVLQHGVVSTGIGLRVVGSYWDLNGFTINNVKKGLVMDAATFNTVTNLEIHTIGEEGIHLKAFSTDNRIAENFVHHTGLSNYKYGEGVYIGSAVTQWCTWTNCLPDASDRNVIANNRFASTAAEAIDIKEGTSFGLIEGNTFDGTGLLARSWVDVKGNNWMIRKNVGTLSARDGFLTETAATGWGTLNTFVGNTAHLQGGSGYGYNMRPGNIVACDNVVTGAALGLTNLGCAVLGAL